MIDLPMLPTRDEDIQADQTMAVTANEMTIA